MRLATSSKLFFWLKLKLFSFKAIQRILNGLAVQLCVDLNGFQVVFLVTQVSYTFHKQSCFSYRIYKKCLYLLATSFSVPMPMFQRMNEYISAVSSMFFLVLLAPWPEFVSMRISTGFLPL